MGLQLDYTNMMAEAVPGAISAALWDESRAALAAAHADVTRRHAANELGFIDLPRAEPLLTQCLKISAWANDERRVTDVVVLGIGGSALGPIALRTALCPSGWNMLDDRDRRGRPRLHVLDNIDPVTIVALLERIELTRTLFLVVSKSGGTAETMAQYLIVRERLDQARLKVADHLVLVTDPEKGALRPIAQRDGLRAADIPPNVGGRFSVLSPVGVLPAALIGIDVRALLAGAGDMAQRCATDDPEQEPGARLCRTAMDRRHPSAEAHARLHAVQRSTTRFRRVVCAAMGRESREDRAALAGTRGTDAHRGPRCDRSALTGSALYGRSCG